MPPSAPDNREIDGLPSFCGYRRADGSAGIRNHVLILCINGLALRVSERIAANLEGAVLAATSSGRGHIEPDLALHVDQLVGLGRNPNVGAVLVVGVDAATTAMISARISAGGKPVASVSFAEQEEDMLSVLEQGIRRGAALVREASRARRETLPGTKLIVGIECGHSDATSGLISNPVVGAAVDLLVSQGATVIAGETVEWLGAEHILAGRASDPSIAQEILQAVEQRESFASASGRSLTGNNPGEENIRGGLSTIEEKSLGAVAKTGSCRIDGVLAVAEPPAAGGLYLMDGPYFSPESMTGFTAAGAQIMLFTTGPGNSTASALAPTIKITGRRETARRLPEQIDFDASPVSEGAETVQGAARRLLATIFDVAGGTLTFGEILGEGLEVPTRVRGSL
ncbi:UxaA family hydrolase [Mesorhizobium sp. VK4C]|uniref:UxaA family hydrolase n=1 Tax=Mesorhizobium captivum TaxID=3072319 RepID=UPI002A24B18C|nr:UxaA family hydrolase [Mesorhizobium sp. VK4C]MDX8503505.1 UxaA family hydrolase [Mesorhizobium sp. VK4C]